MRSHMPKVVKIFLGRHFEVGTITNIHHNLPFRDMRIIDVHEVLLMLRPSFQWRYAIQIITDIVLLDHFCISVFVIPPSDHVIEYLFAVRPR